MAEPHPPTPPPDVTPPQASDMFVAPGRYLRLVLDAEKHGPPCGRGPLERTLGREAPAELADVLTQPCYRIPPGTHSDIRIEFGGEASREPPRGTLRLEVNRGRLERTEIELDGTQDTVTVGYDAPDETIRVSVRAFLEGYARGKAHLHLVPSA